MMNLINDKFIPLSSALAAAISKIAAEPCAKMQLMPKTHNPFWQVRLEFTREGSADGSTMKLLPVPNDDIYWRLEMRIEAQTEAGVKLLKDSIGNGALFQGGVAGLGDGCAKNETGSGLGDGDLNLDHGTDTVAQAVASAS